MTSTRLALVLIRLILAFVSLIYAALKLGLAPETTPLLGLSAAASETANLPYNTNPTFALALIAIVAVVSATLVVTTTSNLITNYRKYGRVAPFSTPLEIALTSVLAVFATYYFVVALLSDGFWFYTGTMAVVLILLATYEGKQYANQH